ncbi:MAG: hypothetical protein HY666_01800 [Chloroflexi bacterium]|nr:hypothetical protein [Chloroflexota bacterium]
MPRIELLSAGGEGVGSGTGVAIGGGIGVGVGAEGVGLGSGVAVGTVLQAVTPTKSRANIRRQGASPTLALLHELSAI